MDKTKQMRFTDSELAIIKNTFAEQEDVLKAIRKVILQLELSAKEVKIIEKIRKNENVTKVLRKTFLPNIDGDAPIHQVIDLWMTLEIKGKDVDVVYCDALAREKLIAYLEQQLGVIDGTTVLSEIKFADLHQIGDKESLDVYVDLTVRNTVLAHTEIQLQQLSVLAGTKEETPEQTKERLFKNSTK